MKDVIDDFYWWEYKGKTGKNRKEKWWLYHQSQSGKHLVLTTFIRPTHLPTKEDIELLELTELGKNQNKFG